MATASIQISSLLPQLFCFRTAIKYKIGMGIKREIPLQHLSPRKKPSQTSGFLIELGMGRGREGCEESSSGWLQCKLCFFFYVHPKAPGLQERGRAEWLKFTMAEMLILL